MSPNQPPALSTSGAVRSATEPRPASRRRFGLSVLLLVSLVTGVIQAPARAVEAPAPAAANSSALGDINLAPNLFYNVSQIDERWSASEVLGGHRIGLCGCMLSALTAMVGFHLNVRPGINSVGAGTAVPHFASELISFEWITGPLDSWYRKRIPLSWVEGYFFSPVYIDRYLREGRPDRDEAENWGYVDKGAGEPCGAAIQPHALQDVAIPSVVNLALPDGTFQSVQVGPTGVAFDYHHELRTDIIDANLQQGRPTIIGRTYPKEGGGFGNHVQIVVGWDAAKGQYRVVDPVEATGAAGETVYPVQPDNYLRWKNEITATIDVYPVPTGQSHFTMVDDPSPIELSTVLPDGRLVGYDPDTGEHEAFRGHSAYEFAAETPPDGSSVPATDPVKGLSTTDPAAGVHRASIIGTGTGTYEVALNDVDADGTQHVLADLAGTIAAGQEVKHEVTYTEEGDATAVAVENFTPQPVVAPVSAVAGEPVDLDAQRSFDADGTVAAIDWSFGDGTTATGTSTTHTWARPGTYPMQVTATDDRGATRTETVNVEVAPAETDVPALQLTADPAAADNGWTSAAEVKVSAAATDAGSGVESITLAAEGADPQAERTIAGDTAQLSLDGEGRTMVTARATDRMGNVTGSEMLHVGIDRTPPVAAVRSPGADRPVTALSLVTGSATDAGSGVAAVEVQVRRADGHTFDGTSWAAGDAWLDAAGSEGWHAAEGLPSGANLPDGAYSVVARATDHAGNTGPASAASAVTVSATAAHGLPVRELQAPAGRLGTEGLALTDLGQAVGTGSPLGLSDSAALRWADSSPTALENPAGRVGSRAHGVDSSGGTVVGTALNQFGQPRATAWVDGSPTDLGSLVSGGISVAHDVNDAGVAVGSSAVVSGLQRSRAVRFAAGQVQLVPDLGGDSSEALAINTRGDVVGYAQAPGSSLHQAFVTPAGGTARLLGDPAAPSSANDINDAGQVAGTQNDEAVIWTDGTKEVLGRGSAQGIAEDGTAAGLVHLEHGPSAALWRDGEQVDLNDLIDAGTGWRLERADGISDDGRFVVGTGILAGKQRGFVLDLGGGTGGGGGADTEAPTTTATVAPPAGANGWTRGPVDVTLTAHDGDGSGVASIAHSAGDPIVGSSGTVRVERDGTTTLAYAATDLAGNVEPPSSTTVRIDGTAPAATASAPQAPPSGWHRAPVEVAVGASDAGSGVDRLSWRVDGGAAVSGPPTRVAVGADGEHVVSVTATDLAGNTSAEAQAALRIDRTPPTVTFSGLDEAAVVDLGTPVLAAASDQHSGLADVAMWVSTSRGGRQPVVPGALLTSAGPTTIEVRATDVAGNEVTIERHLTVEGDDTPAPSDNQVPVAHAGGPYRVAGGDLIQLDGTRSSDPDGDPLTYSWTLEGTPLGTGATMPLRLDPGRYTLVLTVNDGEASSPTWHGGTAITTITVDERPAWLFSGFDAPVKNPPAVNGVRAGSVVPLKFGLGGDRGPSIFAPGFPSSAPVPCGAVGGPPSEVAMPGATQLTYDPTNERYQLNWQTDRAWKGTCRRLTLRFVDGTERTAEFRFT